MSVSINPTVVFIGLGVITVLAGVGEYFKILPPGTASTLIGVLLGSGVYHAATGQANAQANIVPPSATPSVPTPTKVDMSTSSEGTGGING